MKNNLGINSVTSEQLVGDLSVNTVEQQQRSKTNSRQESTKPIIVIFPPVEDMTETITTPSASQLLKTIRNRVARRDKDSNSMASSSSSDSVSGDTGKTDYRSSCSVSETGSDESVRQRRHRSTVSLRRVFESLSLTTRSHSSTPTKRSRQPKKQKQPKCILRSPVTYTYVTGLSGLPTQRIPRYVVCCDSMGLNR